MRILILGLAAGLAPFLCAAQAIAQRDSIAVADSETVADSTALGDSLAVADSAADSDTTAPEDAPAPAAAREIPSLDGYRKVAIVSRDMLPGTPGDETAVEMYRGEGGAQVLRFVTGGVPWGLVVRPPGADPYTLRDFDCSGEFAEALEAGTPLAVPDCAVPEAAGAASQED